MVPSAAAVIYGATTLAMGPVHTDPGRGTSCGAGGAVGGLQGAGAPLGVVDVVAADGAEISATT